LGDPGGIPALKTLNDMIQNNRGKIFNRITMNTPQGFSPLYTDMYQLTMGQAYFLNRRHDMKACFDYFFRKMPFEGGYVVFAGLGNLLKMIEELQFDASDIDYLHEKGFHPDYLDYLKGFRFNGNITGMVEGEIVFSVEPMLRVEGGLLEVQLVETLLLNMLNFQSLIATKANRIRHSAGNRTLSDFGLRRAQGMGGIQASRAAIIGGFDTTSNVFAARQNDIPPAGTMAHSFIESYDDELKAFRAYAGIFPDNCVLLVDTYSTLRSGLPNAIKVGKELVQQGKKLTGIRLDSGDLAYLSKRAREMLDQEGMDYVKIIVSNQLDEHVVKSLLEQKAPVDIFGVGTSMVIGRPDGAIDGVYKLSSSDGKPRLKISENLQKTTLPGRKKVLRYFDDRGAFYADCIALVDESDPQKMTHPYQKEKSLSLEGRKFEDLFIRHMAEGRNTSPAENPFELREKVRHRLEQLPEEHKRFDFPHIYRVGISDKLLQLRDTMVQKLQDYIK